MNTVAFMLNIQPHIILANDWTVYSLFGGGPIYTEALGDSQFTIAGQLGLGLRYNLSSNFALDASARTLRALPVELDGQETHYWTYGALFRLVYTFTAPTEP